MNDDRRAFSRQLRVLCFLRRAYILREGATQIMERERLQYYGGHRLLGRLVVSARAFRSRGTRKETGGDADLLTSDQRIPSPPRCSYCKRGPRDHDGAVENHLKSRRTYVFSAIRARRAALPSIMKPASAGDAIMFGQAIGTHHVQISSVISSSGMGSGRVPSAPENQVPPEASTAA